MALPKTYRAVARLGWTLGHRRPRRRAGADRAAAGASSRSPPASCCSARPPTRPSRSAASAPTSWPGAARRWSASRARSRCTARELLWREGERAAFEIECSAGTYVRTLVADLGDAYCEELERTAIGPFRLEDADAERLLPLAEALSFLPARALAADEARGRSPRRGACGARTRRRAPAARLDGEELVAIGGAAAGRAAARRSVRRA